MEREAISLKFQKVRLIQANNIFEIKLQKHHALLENDVWTMNVLATDYGSYAVEFSCVVRGSDCEGMLHYLDLCKQNCFVIGYYLQFICGFRVGIGFLLPSFGQQ